MRAHTQAPVTAPVTAPVHLCVFVRPRRDVPREPTRSETLGDASPCALERTEIAWFTERHTPFYEELSRYRLDWQKFDSGY